MLTRLRHLLVGMARPLHSRLTYRIRRGLAAGLRRRGGLAFIGRAKPWSAEENWLKNMEGSLAGKTVFDVGGEKGIFSLFFARAVGPGGRLEVFEPNPLQAAEIRTNMGLNEFSHVTVHQAAVGRESGRAQLQFSKWRPGTGSLLRPPSDGGPTASYEVDVVSLDELVHSQALPPPAFVKIDVEGAELLVLRGMEAILSKHRPSLLIEVHDYGPEGESAAKTIVEMLLAQGYHVSHLESGRAVNSAEEAEWLIGGHCAAVPSTTNAVRDASAR